MSQSKTSQHPCLSCGACCAYFRVSFPIKETLKKEDDQQWLVPKSLTEDNGNSILSMKGTNHKHRPSCVALIGKIGRNASCGIYGSRPSPCRNFTASYEDGKHHPRCDEARKKHGLKPLSREAYRDYHPDDEGLSMPEMKSSYRVSPSA